jgi:D-beta-D-heptose 7-phosphate kinase/D-beta-D-heptose 1-phosphate adenosyltransferase
MLAALGCVDHVLIFDTDTPHDVIRAIRPDVLVKGGTYTTGEVVGADIVQAYGGSVHVTRVIEGMSTSSVIAAIGQQVGNVTAQGTARAEPVKTQQTMETTSQ